MPITSMRASPSAESAAGPWKRGRARRAIGGGGGEGGGGGGGSAAEEKEEEEEEEEEEDEEDEVEDIFAGESRRERMYAGVSDSAAERLSKTLRGDRLRCGLWKN
jgi:hypothetical protein